MRMPTSGKSGFSIVEVLVATAILGLLVWQISDSTTLNAEARKRIDQQRQFLEVESSLRANLFKTLSDYVEKTPNCAAPSVGLMQALHASTGTVSFEPLAGGLDPKTMPPQVVQRCGDQSQFSKIRMGIYSCLALSGASGFALANDAYVEAFYGFWDPAKDAGVACDKFNDHYTPLRGAKLFYTIYWRSKKSPPKDGHFMQFSGVMYGQTKN